jgi:hypothetical protein
VNTAVSVTPERILSASATNTALIRNGTRQLQRWNAASPPVARRMATRPVATIRPTEYPTCTPLL